MDGILDAPSGITTRFNYNQLGHISAVREYTGSVTRIDTDTDGRVRQRWLYAAGATTPHSTVVEHPDAFMRMERTSRLSGAGNSLGEVFRTFDQEDRVLTECREAETGGCQAGRVENESQRWVYTREGNLFRSIDGEGLVTQYERDGRKWVTRQLLISPIAGEGVRQVAMKYDDDGNLTRRTFGVANVLTEKLYWDGLNRLTSRVDTQERTWLYGNSKQDVRSSIELVGDGAGATRYTHDEYGRLGAVQKNGVVLASYLRLAGGLPYAESATGRGTRFTRYDDQGNVAWTEDSQGNQSVATESAGAVHIVTSSRIAKNAVRTSGVISELDVLGLPRWTREQGGTQKRTTQFFRDEGGHLEKTIAPDLAETGTTYDFLGRLKLLQQQRVRRATASEDSSYVYNRRGQLSSVVDPAGYETVQLYTGFGDLDRKTGPASTPQVSKWYYDDLGRKTRHVVLGSLVDLGYRYDSAGRVEAIVHGDPDDKASPELVTFTYDPIGRLDTGVRRNLGADGVLPELDRTVVTRRTYDDLNRAYTEETTIGRHTPKLLAAQWSLDPARDRWVRQVTLPSQRIQSHVFDEDGRETEVLRASGMTTTYDWVDGLLQGTQSETQGDIVNRDVVFDGLGQPTSWTHSIGGSPRASIDVRRDIAGRIGSSTIGFEARIGSTTSWRGYVYDVLGRVSVVHEGEKIPDQLPKANLLTEEMGAEIELAGSSSSAIRWAYERESRVGSVVSIRDGVHAPRFRTSLNYLTPTGEPTARLPGHQLEAFEVGNSSRTATHDKAGRLIADDDQTFVFDDLDALAVVGDRRKTPKEAYLYDVQGRLVANVEATSLKAEQLVNDGLQMVEAYDDSEQLKWSATWAPGVDKLLSVADGQEWEYFALDDGKGSVVGWLDSATKELVAFAEYTPEGRAKYTDAQSGGVCVEQDATRCAKPLNIPFGFHSAYGSATTGLLYFRNRWYSSEAGQWLSHDPLDFVDSFSLYAFNAFDSVNFADPLGLSMGPSGLAISEPGDPIEPYDPTLPYVPGSRRVRTARCGEAGCVDATPAQPNAACKGPICAFMGQGPGGTPGSPQGQANVRSTGGSGTGIRGAVSRIVTGGTSDAGTAARDQGRKIVLLVAKVIDGTKRGHPTYKKDLRKLIGQFDEKLVAALHTVKAPVAPGSKGDTVTPIGENDQVKVVEYDGDKIPKLPEGTSVLIYYGHGGVDTPTILPNGGFEERTDPPTFSSQLKEAGGDNLTTIFILGCKAKENGFADGLARLMPNAHVYGATGNIQMNYEPKNLSGGPTSKSSIGLEMDMYDSRE